MTEEATKGLFLLLLLWWRRYELDGVLDGIVYAGMVGIGFAFTENILYLAAAYNGTDGTGPGGTEALAATFVGALPGQPVRAPAVHRPSPASGSGIAVNAAQHAGCGALRRLLGYVAAVARPRDLERLHRLRVRPASSASPTSC